MIALREYVKVQDHQLHFWLPRDFNYGEVEVDSNAPEHFSSIQSIGKAGLHSQSFVEDDEDYSQC